MSNRLGEFIDFFQHQPKLLSVYLGNPAFKDVFVGQKESLINIFLRSSLMTAVITVN